MGCLDTFSHTALVAFLVLRPRPHCRRASTVLSSTLATLHPSFSFFFLSPCSRVDPLASLRWPLCFPIHLSRIVVLPFSPSTLPRLHIHPGAALLHLFTILQTEKAQIAGTAQTRMIWISSGSRNRSSCFQESVSGFFLRFPILTFLFCRLWTRFRPTLSLLSTDPFPPPTSLTRLRVASPKPKALQIGLIQYVQHV